MGSKYVFKPDSNPPVGGYDTERGDNAIKFRNRETIIREDIIKEKRKPQPSPDAGYYDKHLTPFGSDLKTTAHMGSKYVFKPDSNPPVGAYDTERAESIIKFRNQETIIKEPTVTYRRPKEHTPAPG
jgi:hypothetical protein